MKLLLFIAIIIVLLLLIFVYVLTIYNSLVMSKHSVSEAFSTMDVYLKKRWDLIPNLVESVKGYAKHESETLQNVIKERNSNYHSMSPQQKINTGDQLSNTLSKLMMLAESYPELKANENFIMLNDELSDVEDEIANSRKYYNAVVKKMNNQIDMFPSNIVSKLFHFKKSSMFETAVAERENIHIKF